MPSEKLNLRLGSIIHIEGFSSHGHPAKNKFLLVLGRESIDVALGFLISSQLHYLKMETHKDEVVRLPSNATTCLDRESIIQRFSLERLSVDMLSEDFDDGKVKNKGMLSTSFVSKVKKAVENSKLLTPRDIASVMSVLKG